MTVTCTTIDEFLECLAAEERFFQSTIRVSIGRGPIGAATDKTAVKFNVFLQAACVVEVVTDQEHDQYLLQFGTHCGVDYEDASQDREGTAAAEKMKQRIADYAKSRSLRILPGVIGE